MRRYLARRVVAFGATLFVVSLLVFVVIRVIPGDPVLIIMGTEGSPEAAAALRKAMGLDRPLLVQYAEWVRSALRGDLGRSIQYDVPVGGLILSRLRVTLPLTLLAALFMAAVALPLRMPPPPPPLFRAPPPPLPPLPRPPGGGRGGGVRGRGGRPLARRPLPPPAGAG